MQQWRPSRNKGSIAVLSCGRQGALVVNQFSKQRAKRIFIVGPMGAGKTTIGRGLAKRLGWDFYDADAEIERRSGVEIARIFEKEGEPGFRRRECFTMENLTHRENIVLATGGGAVLNDDNRVALGRGFCIYLHSPVEVQLERTSRNNRRPLLQVADPKAKLQSLFDERDPLYREVADVVVDSVRDHPRTMVDKMLATLPKEWQPPKRRNGRA